MATYFISRHTGARDWIQAQNLAVDEYIAHLDVSRLNPGDIVIGSLPIHLAAEVCARGARYQHLSIDLPAGMRGMELNAERMAHYGARLEEFTIIKKDTALSRHQPQP